MRLTNRKGCSLAQFVVTWLVSGTKQSRWRVKSTEWRAGWTRTKRHAIKMSSFSKTESEEIKEKQPNFCSLTLYRDFNAASVTCWMKPWLFSSLCGLKLGRYSCLIIKDLWLKWSSVSIVYLQGQRYDTSQQYKTKSLYTLPKCFTKERKNLIYAFVGFISLLAWPVKWK